MASLFCGGCGKDGLKDSWKHCPHCGFKVLVPKLDCIFLSDVDYSLESEDWLFVKSDEMAREVIEAGFAQRVSQIADTQWGEEGIEEFNHNHFRLAFKHQNNDVSAPVELELNLVITALPASEVLGNPQDDIDRVQVRLIDDGWLIEVQSVEKNWKLEGELALKLREAFGGEVYIVKPKKARKG
jgi:hypothetical protein